MHWFGSCQCGCKNCFCWESDRDQNSIQHHMWVFFSSLLWWYAKVPCHWSMHGLVISTLFLSIHFGTITLLYHLNVTNSGRVEHFLCTEFVSMFIVLSWFGSTQLSQAESGSVFQIWEMRNSSERSYLELVILVGLGSNQFDHNKTNGWLS